MKFDFRKFAGGVASGLAADIRERREDAEKFEDQQEALAERNIPYAQKKQALANTAAQYGHRARALGATDAQIKNALSSGVNGVKEFYDKLQAVVDEKGVKTLGKVDIEAITNMPNIPDVDFKFADGDYNKFVSQTYGIDLPKRQAQEEDDSIIRTIFGLNAKDKARERLSNRQIYEGMSVSDINTIARNAEYESLFPEATMTFTDVNFFGKKDLRQFTKDLQTGMAAASRDVGAKEAIEQAGDLAAKEYAKDKERGNIILAEQDKLVAQAREDKRNLIEAEAAKIVIDNALDTYHIPDLLQNESFKRMVVASMGQGYLDMILEENEMLERQEGEDTREIGAFEEIKSGMEEAERQTQAGIFDQEETEQQSPQEEDTQEEAPNTEAQKEALLNKTFPERPSRLNAKRVGWDEKYKGKVNPETNKAIIAPPRPADGGEKTAELPSVNVFGISNPATMRKVTEAEYWDATYGDTHDPSTGLPLGVDKLLED